MCQPDDRQLGRRAANERCEDAEIVGGFGSKRRLRPGDVGKRRLPLDTARRQERPDADDLPFRDVDASATPLLLTWNDEADAQIAEPTHALHVARGGLEGGDAVAQARRVFEAKVAREALQLRLQLRQRVLECLPLDALEGARSELSGAAARQWSELAGLRRADDGVTAPTKVDVAVGAHRSAVRRRSQLSDQAQLLERRLDLGAE